MLISVVMLTYNDEQFIERTLESVKAQTYRNIELVISDDLSLDNTVDVCRKWLQKNGSRFSSVKLLTTEVNTGVTANCIRANAAANGEWLKSIGGDNLMTPDCIEKFVKYVEENPKAEFVQCRLDIINEKDEIIGHRLKGPDRVFHNNRTTAEQQYQLFLRKDPIDALGMFKKRSVLLSEECYDTDFRNQEDTPFAIRILKSGHKIWWIDDALVKRRMRVGSLSGLSDAKIVVPNNVVRIDIDKKYFLPAVGCFEKIILKYKAHVVKMTFNGKYNLKTPVNLKIWSLRNLPVTLYLRYKIRAIKRQIVKSWK